MSGENKSGSGPFSAVFAFMESILSSFNISGNWQQFASCHHTLVGCCSATLFVHVGSEVEGGRKAVGFSFFKLIGTMTFRTK